MDQVKDFIGKNDGVVLYVIFALQCCTVFLGFPLLLAACSSTDKRLNLKYSHWMAKWTLICLVGKWMLATYDLVEQQMVKDNSGVDMTDFDPYRLLHITNDGSFNTTLMRTEYKRLRSKYNPVKVSE